MNDELNKLLNELRASSTEEQPDKHRLAGIAARLEASLAPVRPLPSRATIIFLVFTCFVAFSVAAAFPFGYFGFVRLDPLERALYYLPIGAAAALLISALDQEVIPGSRRLVAPGLLVAVVFAVLSGLVMMLFPKFTMTKFVAHGIPCLRLGTICALLFGALLTIWLRRGYAVSRIRAGLIGGFLAGLTGVSVLALHCPILNAGHILLWHFGSAVIALTFGVLIGAWYGPRNRTS